MFVDPRYIRAREEVDASEPRVALMLALAFVFSAYDALFTLVWVEGGVAHELNPLMAGLLNAGAVPFFAVKVLVSGSAIGMLWWARGHRWALWGSGLVFSSYTGITYIHLMLATV
ncbi:MAG: hypothetical protein KC561_08865 [Myxococcales bacterium]|nr:hypothetical protein [Myxococcales bacterium]